MELHGVTRFLLDPITSELFSPGSILSIYSLTCTFVFAVCALAWRQKKRRGHAGLPAIFRAIARTPVAAHKSFHADVKILALCLLVLPPVMLTLMVSAHTISVAVRSSLQAMFGSVHFFDGRDALVVAVSTIILFLAYEIGYFVDHYLKHRVGFLWELHKVHHTAEVLTPLTNYRNHPLDNVIFGYMLSIFIGSASGVLAWLFDRETQIIAIDGKNVIFIVFLWTIGHLQHSQFWIPVSGPWGRVIMSPAHHQIHHSDDPKHFNRNMGSVLALWDWMFGTLEIPSAENPRLSYGVKEEGEDAHSWFGILAAPVIGAASAFWRALVSAKNWFFSAGNSVTDTVSD
jgi:sterol desaturase/sphingolipid hydroxylase (fatty acid hydroxylase superfamily)